MTIGPMDAQSADSALITAAARCWRQARIMMTGVAAEPDRARPLRG